MLCYCYANRDYRYIFTNCYIYVKFHYFDSLYLLTFIRILKVLYKPNYHKLQVIVCQCKIYK